MFSFKFENNSRFVREFFTQGKLSAKLRKKVIFEVTKCYFLLNLVFYAEQQMYLAKSRDFY